jgi:hypothetical protein
MFGSKMLFAHLIICFLMMLLLSQQLKISPFNRGGEGKGKSGDEPKKKGSIFYSTLIDS